MGVLFQSLFILLLIGAGTAGILSNFTQQKINHLSRLEESDRNQIRNSLDKYLSSPESCKKLFQNINLNDNRNIVGVTLLDPTNPSVSVLYNLGAQVGSLEISMLDLSVEDCTAPSTNCIVGSVTYTKELRLSFRLISGMATSRTLAGETGKILINPESSTGATDCFYSKGSIVGGSSPASGFSDCATFFGAQVPSGSTNCQLSNLIAAKLTSAPLAPNQAAYLDGAEDVVSKISRTIASGLKDKGCSEYRGVQSINPNGEPICSYSSGVTEPTTTTTPPNNCNAANYAGSLGSNNFCYAENTGTGFNFSPAGPGPAALTTEFVCPTGFRRIARFDRRQLIGRICQPSGALNPAFTLPANSCSQLIQSNNTNCVRLN
jgi:hypothetical protein